MTRKSNYIERVLQDDKGEPSSKRIAAFITLFYTLTMYAIKGSEMSIDVLWSLLLFAGAALGISELGKLRKKSD